MGWTKPFARLVSLEAGETVLGMSLTAWDRGSQVSKLLSWTSINASRSHPASLSRSFILKESEHPCRLGRRLGGRGSAGLQSPPGHVD